MGRVCGVDVSVFLYEVIHCLEKYPGFSSILSCPLSRLHSVFRAFLDPATSVTLDTPGTNASIVSCQAYFWKLFVMES